MSQSSETPVVHKKGIVNKCPSCGTPLGAFVTSCESCGHELSGTEANRTIVAFNSRFDEIDREADDKELMGNKRKQFIIEKKARVIRDFPVTNTREDLQELLFYIMPKVKDSVSPDPNINDWREKFNEVLLRAKNAYRNDSNALAQFESIEKGLQTGVGEKLQLKAKRNPLLVVLLAGICIVAVFGLVSAQMKQAKLQKCQDAYTQDAQVEKSRLEKIQAAVVQKQQEKNYTEALSQASKLRWEYESPCGVEENKKAVALWDANRNELTLTIEKSMNLDAAAEQGEADRKVAIVVAEQQKTVEIAKLKAEKETAKAQAQANKAQAQAAKIATAKRKETTEKEW